MSFSKMLFIATLVATAGFAKSDPPLTVEQTLTAAFAELRAIAQASAPQVEVQRAVLPKQLLETSVSAKDHSARQSKPAPVETERTTVAGQASLAHLP